MTVTGYKKKKLAKKYYDLEFSLFQNGKKSRLVRIFSLMVTASQQFAITRKKKFFILLNNSDLIIT